MASETTTPNIGLQIAAFDQANWQVPTNYNWNLLDLIFGGFVTVPALNVEVLTAGNAGDFILPPFVGEVPAGTAPTTIYTLSFTPSQVLGIYKNGLLLVPGLAADYTLTGNIVTLNAATAMEDVIYATYFH
jgi:hypothetical protein